MPNPLILTQVPLFAGLSAGELEALATCLRRRHYAKGQIIFYQEDPGSTLCIIETGQVKIVLTSPEGKEVILSLLDQGDFFGELALLDGEPRSANAVAKEACQLLILHREDFLPFLEGHPRAATKLLATLSGRLRRADQMVHDVAFLDVPARLARTLLKLAEDQGQAVEEGIEISSRLTQAELAEMVGATRESINKCLRFFERQGLVRRHRGQLTVLRPQELRKRIY